MINSISNYIDHDKFLKLYQLCSSLTIDEVRDFLINITEYDDSPDLTEIHPRDRKNIDFRICIIYGDESLNLDIQERFSSIIDAVKEMKGVVRAALVNIGPSSIMPLHVDDMQRPLYDESTLYNVFIGLTVPDYNSSVVGVKIGNQTLDHSTPIVFDAQVPHEAWNQSDKDWLSLLLYINKEHFKKV